MERKRFQVVYYYEIDQHHFAVDGRFVNGNDLHPSDEFHLMEYKNQQYQVNYRITAIVAYSKTLSFLPVGMTARLTLAGQLTILPEGIFEIVV